MLVKKEWNTGQKGVNTGQKERNTGQKGVEHWSKGMENRSKRNGMLVKKESRALVRVARSASCADAQTQKGQSKP